MQVHAPMVLCVFLGWVAPFFTSGLGWAVQYMQVHAPVVLCFFFWGGWINIFFHCKLWGGEVQAPVVLYVFLGGWMYKQVGLSSPEKACRSIWGYPAQQKVCRSIWGYPAQKKLVEAYGAIQPKQMCVGAYGAI